MPPIMERQSATARPKLERAPNGHGIFHFGTFSKGLGFEDLSTPFMALIVTVPILVGLGTALLRKQAS